MAEAVEEIGTLTAAHKKSLLARLARVEGQLRGVQKMIQREEECEAVAQQLAAARAALNKAFYELITCSIEHQLVDQGGADPAVHDRLSELVKLLTRYG